MNNDGGKGLAPKFKIVPFPADFPEKGRYRTPRVWNPSGFSDDPMYNGQMPVTYPLEASLLEIQCGGFIVNDDE